MNRRALTKTVQTRSAASKAPIAPIASETPVTVNACSQAGPTGRTSTVPYTIACRALGWILGVPGRIVVVSDMLFLPLFELFALIERIGWSKAFELLYAWTSAVSKVIEERILKFRA